jgi:DNA-binding transcriptional MerR regulator
VSRAASARSSGSSRPSSTFSIGEVLARLRPDFPDITISKIRFLEAEGLIEPQRAPSGYRKFGHHDVERLRFVLTAQRDHYLPLRVIKDHLDALDQGLEPPALPVGPPQVPRVVSPGESHPSADAFREDTQELRMSRSELLESAEIGASLLSELESYGLVVPRTGRDPYDGDALVIARIAGELASYGVEPRHLRAFKTAADREVGLVEQVVAPLLRQRGVDSRGRAEEVTRELLALSVRLHATLVKVGLRTRS